MSVNPPPERNTNNFYELVNPDDLVQHYNPNPCALQFPFRLLLCGPTGTGKTNALCRIIREGKNFSEIFIFCQCVDEPLYKLIKDEFTEYDKKGKEVNCYCYISSDIEDLPLLPGDEGYEPDDITPGSNQPQRLIVFDDFICGRKSNIDRIKKFYIMARKAGYSCVAQTQSYFATEHTIRKQCNYIGFTAISDKRNLGDICRQLALGIDATVLERMILEFTGDFPNFFLIDLHTKDRKKMFRPIIDDFNQFVILN